MQKRRIIMRVGRVLDTCCVCVCIHTYIYTYIRIYIHITCCVCVCIYTYIYTYIRMYIHIIHIHSYLYSFFSNLESTWKHTFSLYTHTTLIATKHIVLMEWLRLVGSLNSWVSFAKEPYKRDCILLFCDSHNSHRY